MITSEQQKAWDRLQKALTVCFKAFQPTGSECAGAYFDALETIQVSETATDYDVISYVHESRSKDVISD